MALAALNSWKEDAADEPEGSVLTVRGGTVANDPEPQGSPERFASNVLAIMARIKAA